MNAAIIAIGPFAPEIAQSLEYPAELYAHTRTGTTVAVTVFFIESGTSDSRRLAACFGIDPWDFNQHELEASCADLGGLRELFGERDVASFVALREAGFRFFFMPNG